PLVGIRKTAAFAAPAFFRGAGLVVDERSDARNSGKLALHRHELIAVVYSQPARPIFVLRIFPRLVRDDDNALDAFGRDLARDLGNGEAAVVGLTPRHRHGIIEQNLVGDVHAGGDGGADRQISGMIVGAVAQILK